MKGFSATFWDCWRNQKVRQGLVGVNLVKVRKYLGCMIDGISEIQINISMIVLQYNEAIIAYGEVAEEVKDFCEVTSTFTKKGCISSGAVG